MGFDYTHTKKTWMNRSVFFEWLCHFDKYISRTRLRKVLSLLDSATCQDNGKTLPNLRSFEVLYLPKNTTSHIQPCDAGKIPNIKRRYGRHQICRALTLLCDENEKDLYSIDLQTAILWMYDIWSKLESTFIHNCWVKIELLEEYMPHQVTIEYFLKYWDC